MSGAVCMTCFANTNDATIPRCDRAECPNKETGFFFHKMESPDACAHDFQGWREFEDGRGGERVCTKCGMGAMTYSLRTGF